MRLRALVLALGVSAFVQFSVVGAETIKYVFDGTASGTLGSQTFSNVDLNESAVTDTASVPANGEQINFAPMPFTIDIGGVGSTTVSTGLLSLFHNASFQFVAAGWKTSSSEIDVIEINNPAFLTYDMTTSIGPITETGSDPFIGNWQNMSTSGGNLTVTSWDNVSFTATLGSGTGGSNAVPLPSAAWLSLIGLPLAAIAARRRSAV